MKNIKKMIECRALFLQSIAYLNHDNIELDDNFNLILEGFLENYFQGLEESFNLIYYFDIDDDGNLMVREEEEWVLELNKYLNYFRNNDNDKVKKLYDDIGYYNINKISELANLFMEYIIILKDMTMSKIRN